MTALLYDFPDMSEKSRLTFPIVWNDINYTFSLTNNIRSEEIVLEIKTNDSNGSEIVVAKNLNIVININLMQFTCSKERWDKMGQPDVGGIIYLRDRKTSKKVYFDVVGINYDYKNEIKLSLQKRK